MREFDIIPVDATRFTGNKTIEFSRMDVNYSLRCFFRGRCTGKPDEFDGKSTVSGF